MRTYRYKVHKAGFGVFVGVAAEAFRLDAPPTTGVPVSGRVRLDASEVRDVGHGNRLTLSEPEVAWLRFGLLKVSDAIEAAEGAGHVLIVVRALELYAAHYAEAALAPALAGWAEEEFGLPARRCHARLDGVSGQFTFDWD